MIKRSIASAFYCLFGTTTSQGARSNTRPMSDHGPSRWNTYLTPNRRENSLWRYQSRKSNNPNVTLKFEHEETCAERVFPNQKNRNKESDCARQSVSEISFCKGEEGHLDKPERSDGDLLIFDFIKRGIHRDQWGAQRSCWGSGCRAVSGCARERSMGPRYARPGHGGRRGDDVRGNIGDGLCAR